MGVKLNRIGEEGINKQGLNMKIIEYFGRKDITIKFNKTGTILKNKTYSKFKSGDLIDLEYENIKKVGKSIFNTQKQLMTIIKANGCIIDVQFEDGTIVKEKEYRDFKKGYIQNPNKTFEKLRVGEKIENKQGLMMEIIEYIRSDNITIKFEDGVILSNKRYSQFLEGSILNPNLKRPQYIEIERNRINEENTNYQGLKMKIVKYNGYSDLIVEFENGELVNSNYESFKNGRIKSNLHYSVYGFGFSDVEITYENRKSYDTWYEMIKRCYNDNLKNKYYTYKDCIVCDEWRDFKIFENWYNENFWCDDCNCLDKDILIKGNKTYSPDACVFVDIRLNSLFTKCNKSRGDLPIGVYYRKDLDRYIAQCSMLYENGKRQKNLGSYKDPIKAFYAYKDFKESYIKQVADEYKEKYPNFPEKLYQAMYNWEVEITD